jgi:hypothetical protein
MKNLLFTIQFEEDTNFPQFSFLIFNPSKTFFEILITFEILVALNL